MNTGYKPGYKFVINIVYTVCFIEETLLI